MIYPSYYPAQGAYGGYYGQQAANPTNTAQNSASVPNPGLTWVQGEAGAKSYLVAPNTTVQLWDSEAQVIYLKSADASGMPSMKVIDYTIRDQAPVNVSGVSTGYATHEEIEQIRKEIEAVRGRLDELGKEAVNA